MSEQNLGPTVIEYAKSRIRKIGRIIADLETERAMLNNRIAMYEEEGMQSELESERIAHWSDGFFNVHPSITLRPPTTPSI